MELLMEARNTTVLMVSNTRALMHGARDVRTALTQSIMTVVQ